MQEPSIGTLGTETEMPTMLFKLDQASLWVGRGSYKTTTDNHQIIKEQDKNKGITENQKKKLMLQDPLQEISTII